MLQFLCLLLAWLAATPLPLHAQSPSPAAAPASVPVAAPGAAPAASPAYQKLIDDGIQEFRRGNFAESRSLFARANAIHSNARTLRGLGLTELELGNYVDSADLLRSALDSKVRPLTGPLRSETEDVLRRAESFIGRITIAATPVPPTAVLVDGMEVRLRDGNLLLLPVGDHALELMATGFVSSKLTKKIQGGEQETLEVAFHRHEATPLPAVTAAEPAAPLALTPASMPPRDQDPRRPLYKNPWLWTAVGVVVTGAAVGLAVGLRKDGKIADPLVFNPIATKKGP